MARLELYTPSKVLCSNVLNVSVLYLYHDLYVVVDEATTNTLGVAAAPPNGQ